MIFHSLKALFNIDLIYPGHVPEKALITVWWIAKKIKDLSEVKTIVDEGTY